MTVADIVPIIVRLAYVRLMGTLIFRPEEWTRKSIAQADRYYANKKSTPNRVLQCTPTAVRGWIRQTIFFAHQSPERSFWYGVQESGRDGVRNFVLSIDFSIGLCYTHDF